MDMQNAENFNWNHFNAECTLAMLRTLPDVGNDRSVPFFLHGKYVEQFWVGDINKPEGVVTLCMASSETMAITIERDLTCLSINNGIVDAVHYPEVG